MLSLFSDNCTEKPLFSGSQRSKQPRITPRTYGLEKYISLNAMLGKETSQHVPWGQWLWNGQIGAQPHDWTKGPSPGPNRAASQLLFYHIFQDISWQHYLSCPLIHELSITGAWGSPPWKISSGVGPRLQFACFKIFYSNISAAKDNVHYATLVPGVVHPGMNHQVWAQAPNQHICTEEFTAT